MMKINDPASYKTREETEVLAQLLDLEDKRVLELGCGDAWMTRQIAERLKPREIVATEVDCIQHQKNLQLDDPTKRIVFRPGGAERIDDPDQSYDAVLMFKSLHHVPTGLMGQALREILRVLKPVGLVYFSEPVYWGEFNELMRRIHDERQVREAAFAALKSAVQEGLFDLEAEVFFQSPGVYESWEVFEDRFLNVTHTDLDIDAERYAEIKDLFHRHLTPTGAHFLRPHRVDLLRKH